MRKIIILYLSASALYRLTNGVLLLAISWRLLDLGHGSARGLALSTLISFLPALLAAPTVRALMRVAQPRKLTGSVLAALAGMTVLSLLGTHDTVLLIASLFGLWSLYFVLEASWEAWLVELLQNESDEGVVRRTSSVAAMVAQAALMLGPLLVGPLSRNFGALAPWALACVAYLIAAALVATSRIRTISQAASTAIVTKRPPNRSLREAFTATPWLFCALALVWPSLAMINMMVPLYARVSANTKVDFAGWLDCAVSLGMALSAVLVNILGGALLQTTGRKLALTACGAVAFAILTLATPGTFGALTMIAIAGGAFGAMRIFMRMALVRTLDAEATAIVVSMANALALPIIMVASTLYALGPATLHLAPMATLTAFFGASLIAIIGEGRLPEHTLISSGQ